MNKSALPQSTPWYVYILRTAAGTLYTGISTDPGRRVKEHENGKGARSLRGRGPLALEHVTEVADRPAALRLEARIKRLTRAQKEALIRGEHPLPPLVS